MAEPAPVLGRVVAFDAELSFHATRLSDGSRSAEVGARVAYVVGPGPRPGSWEATVVVKTG